MSTDGVAVGIDIGGTNIRGVAWSGGEILGAASKARRPDDPDDLVDALVSMVTDIGERGDAPVVAFGVGCAGVVDRSGVVRTSPNIASLVDFPLRDRLIERVDAAVVVENDATMATWAEAQLGAAAGHDDVAFVALGTGIGTGFVLDGQLYRGAHGFAGESGHITIVEGGIPCVCGRRGCWERYSSGTALNRLAREAAAAGDLPTLVERAGGDPAAVTSELLVSAIGSGEAGVADVLAELGRWTAIGLANLVNILDPSVIVMGGGLADIGEPLLDAIRAGYDDVMVDRHHRDPVTIVGSRFGGGSGAIGAALLAADAVGA